MSEPQSVESIDRSPYVPRSPATHPRAVGSPLPTGAGKHSTAGSAEGSGSRILASAPGRALPAPAPEESQGVQRAVNVFRTIVPIVQRVLPLLDGNLGTAISNLLAPRPHPPALPPQPKVDLAPLENSLSALQTQHSSLREQVMEQNSSLKRVEDQLEMVREATDRNTLEQQELLEDLKLFSNKVKAVAFIGLGLIAIGIILNLILFLHIQRVLP